MKSPCPAAAPTMTKPDSIRVREDLAVPRWISLRRSNIDIHRLARLGLFLVRLRGCLQHEQGAGREHTSTDMRGDVGGISLRKRETGEARSSVDRSAAAEKVSGRSLLEHVIWQRLCAGRGFLI